MTIQMGDNTAVPQQGGSVKDSGNTAGQPQSGLGQQQNQGQAATKARFTDWASI